MEGMRPAEADIAAVARLLGDDTRAELCAVLLDGRARTVTELARACGVARSTASEHVARLAAGGLLHTVRQGRHVYVRLAGPEVSELIESLARLAPPRPVRTLRQASAGRALAWARTCYDHLAGTVAVALADALADAGLLAVADGYALTPLGRERLAALGVRLPEDDRRRPPVRPCLDWTERRFHLAGALGAALCRRLFERVWVERVGTGRAVRVTAVGEQGLREHFGLDLAALRAAGTRAAASRPRGALAELNAPVEVVNLRPFPALHPCVGSLGKSGAPRAEEEPDGLVADREVTHQ